MIEGLKIYELKKFSDDRGYFTVSWDSQKVPYEFKQDNLSHSYYGTLRGLHFQREPHAQGKYVGVIKGCVWDVAVDIRKDSKTYLQWFGIELSGENNKRMYIPPGFAHGFIVLSDEAWFIYKCTELYNPEAEDAIVWDDPTINIQWPIQPVLISEKDKNAKRFDKI